MRDTTVVFGATLILHKGPWRAGALDPAFVAVSEETRSACPQLQWITKLPFLPNAGDLFAAYISTGAHIFSIV
jgi:hypothetical protein